LIQFVRDADEHWCFSGLGTHCLENFFGFVRRNSLGDDRYGRPVGIIAKSTMVYEMMHDLGLEIKHSGRDNIGGTVIGPGPVEFDDQRAHLYHLALIRIAHLDFNHRPGLVVPSFDQMREIIAEWSRYDHHPTDPICNAVASPVCNCRITGRNMGA
jgi:hypothetical protein